MQASTFQLCRWDSEQVYRELSWISATRENCARKEKGVDVAWFDHQSLVACGEQAYLVKMVRASLQGSKPQGPSQAESRPMTRDKALELAREYVRETKNHAMIYFSPSKQTWFAVSKHDFYAAEYDRQISQYELVTEDGSTS